MKKMVNLLKVRPFAVQIRMFAGLTLCIEFDIGTAQHMWSAISLNDLTSDNRIFRMSFTSTFSSSSCRVSCCYR